MITCIENLRVGGTYLCGDVTKAIAHAKHRTQEAERRARR